MITKLKSYLRKLFGKDHDELDHDELDHNIVSPEELKKEGFTYFDVETIRTKKKNVLKTIFKCNESKCKFDFCVNGSFKSKNFEGIDHEILVAMWESLENYVKASNFIFYEFEFVTRSTEQETERHIKFHFKTLKRVFGDDYYVQRQGGKVLMWKRS